jgi:hypothetical protein
VPSSGGVRKGTTFEVIFSPFARVFAPLALALSAVLPPDGTGIDLCLVHRVLGVPCPACGLTRSFTSLTHARFEQAVVFHPFGPVLYAMFVLAALYGVLPSRVRDRIVALAAEREPEWRRGYRLFLVAFLGFGVVRALFHGTTGAAF